MSLSKNDFSFEKHLPQNFPLLVFHCCYDSTRSYIIQIKGKTAMEWGQDCRGSFRLLLDFFFMGDFEERKNLFTARVNDLNYHADKSFALQNTEL